MVHPDDTPAATGRDAGAVRPEGPVPTPAEPVAPPAEPVAPPEAPVAPPEAPPGSAVPQPTAAAAATGAADDADIVDAELVPTPPSVTPVWTPPPTPGLDYTDAGVPTLEYLQDKIDRRYGNALGGTELAESTIPEVQSAAKAQREREQAAADRLAEIRRSLHPDG